MRDGLTGLEDILIDLDEIADALCSLSENVDNEEAGVYAHFSRSVRNCYKRGYAILGTLGDKQRRKAKAEVKPRRKSPETIAIVDALTSPPAVIESTSDDPVISLYSKYLAATAAIEGVTATYRGDDERLDEAVGRRCNIEDQITHPRGDRARLDDQIALDQRYRGRIL
jgi:hypothetical protein